MSGIMALPANQRKYIKTAQPQLWAGSVSYTGVVVDCLRLNDNGGAKIVKAESMCENGRKYLPFKRNYQRLAVGL